MNYALICTNPKCGNYNTSHGITHEEYTSQLIKGNDVWKCPKCGDDAIWDDDVYDSNFPLTQAAKEEAEQSGIVFADCKYCGLKMTEHVDGKCATCSMLDRMAENAMENDYPEDHS